MSDIFSVELVSLDEGNIRTDLGTGEELALLGKSLARWQDYPILVGPLIAGRRRIIDGHRRARAARQVGLTKLDAIEVQGNPTPDQIVQIQYRTAVHRKGLSEPERAKAVKIYATAHPELTRLKMSDDLEIDNTTLTKLLAEGIDEVESAFSGLKIGLAKRYELSKWSPEQQRIGLAKALKGGSLSQIIQAMKDSENSGNDDARHEKVTIPMGLNSVKVQAKKGEKPLNLAETRVLLVQALAKVDQAISSGFGIKTAAKAWVDTKDRMPKVRKKKETA